MQLHQPEVQVVPIDQLKPWAKNPRKGHATKEIQASINTFGYLSPIVVQAGTFRVLAGHGRLTAMKKDGVKDVPVIIATLTDEQADAFTIADNKIASKSEFDLGALADIIKSMDRELSLVAGFSDSDLRKLGLSPAADDGPEPQFDKAAELQVKWKTELGQIWEIGPHLLLCGNSLDIATIELLMNGARAAMCFTDPPWNVNIGGDNNPRHRQRSGLQNDSMPQVAFSSFLDSVGKTIARFTAGDVYCVMGTEQWPNVDAALRASKLHWSDTIVWVKDLFVLGRSKYHRRYEPIWYGWPEGSKSSFEAGRDQDDVWEIARPRASEEHPTMKPVELYRRALTNSSASGALVFDPFTGSGTLLVAAEQIGRVARCCEIDPKYVAVGLERMSSMGLKPKLLT